jgi:RNA polymerase sigma-70 factor, ECF subfamily
MRVERIDPIGTTQEETTAIARPGAEPDDDLVNAAINGSNEAFGLLFERHERSVFHIAHRILRNREDAEDATQQAFESALIHLTAFHGQSRFSTWLTRIAINEALMLLRRRRPGHVSIEGHVTVGEVSIALDLQDTAATPEERCEQQELQDFLSEAIQTLRPVLQQVVQMREIRELSTQKTAMVLGLSGGTVKARLFRARSALRRKLTERLRAGSRTRGRTEPVLWNCAGWRPPIRSQGRGHHETE